jgi:ribosomal RNA-processing protein 12
MEEVLGRIRAQEASKLPHIKQPAVLLKAIDATLEETQTGNSPTAYFAALSATLDSLLASSNASQELFSAVLYLQAAVASFVPKAVYASKSQTLASSLSAALSTLSAQAEAAPALKSLLSISQNFYAALPPSELSSLPVSQLFNTFLLLLSDGRPKLRRKAQEMVQAIAFEGNSSAYQDRVAKHVLNRIIEAAKEARQPKKRSAEAANAELLALCAFLHLVVMEWPEKVSLIILLE